jgi:maleylacetate reductase
MRFVHETAPQRVRFASGDADGQLAEEISMTGLKRLMVIADESARDAAVRLTEGLPVVITHDEVVMHVPRAVATRARDAALARDADALVCVGGGSTTGLAKAVALETGLPIIAVPTTYAGSEATSVWGITEDRLKKTGTDPRVLPRAIIYDATLTMSLPVDLSVASGLNALAHCIDSMWAPRADPINAAFAVEGVRALRTGLRMIKDDPSGLPGREHALYGAYLSATAFASAGSGLHHKICHVLGGMFDLPHAQTHAVVLPHVLAANAPHAVEVERRVAEALDSETAHKGLRALQQTLDAPTALRDYGMPEDGIAPAAEAVFSQVPAGNPAPLMIDDLVSLLRAAWEGALP